MKYHSSNSVNVSTTQTRATLLHLQPSRDSILFLHLFFETATVETSSDGDTHTIETLECRLHFSEVSYRLNLRCIKKIIVYEGDFIR